MPAVLLLEKFIEKANIKHKHVYNYSSTIYKNSHTKIIIKCNIHGDFEKTPTNHLTGQGCTACDINNHFWTNVKFINSGKSIHNYVYTYDNAVFLHPYKKGIITCMLHGNVNRRPNDHINNRAGCPKCAKKRVSRMEKDWLDFTKVPGNITHRQVQIKTINKTYTIDGLMTETNRIYEFLGDFWPGNSLFYNINDAHSVDSVDKGVTYGLLYQKYLDKKYALAGSGYNIIEIWESEWKRSK